MKKSMILVIDGCAPEYLNPEATPNLFQLAGDTGFMKKIKCQMPSVTNVNHACILSGQFPEKTKVVGNYYFNPQTKEEGFIEEKGFMKAPTIVQAYKEQNLKTAFLTVKGKVLGVYGEGVDIGISVQAPDLQLLDRLGLDMPPKVDDISSTEWIMKAALACVEQENPDFIYCTTNDYGFHHYAPDEAPAKEQLKWIDYYINEIYKVDPDRQIYITADHGMNQKHTIVNFQHIVDHADISAYCLAPLKDRYVENHIYQEGGMLYIFLENKDDGEKLIKLVSSIPEIENILTNIEAAKQYHLPEDGIGDYVLFSAKDCAFGEIEGEYLHTEESRTHGSLYEQEIPLIAINPLKSEECYEYSKDIVAHLLKTFTQANDI